MKKTISLLLSLFVLLSLAACEKVPQSYSKSFLDLFDTACSITAADSSQQAFDSHFQLVYSELKAYSQLYDIYDSYGSSVNLKYINENAAKAPVKADKRIIDLLVWGKEAYEISGGRVNIAMGAVLSVWHEAREYASQSPDSAYLPDMDVLREKNKHTDINSLVIDEEESTVYFADPELQIDAGAIAKGFICEKISEFEFKQAVSDIQVSGGHIYCMSDTEVFLLSDSGEKLRSADCGFGAVWLAVTGSNEAAVITDNRIDKVKLVQ